MHILIAPNAFKNSLTAWDAAVAIDKGLQQSKLVCTSECFPIADGGDGTAELIIKKYKGSVLTKEVTDPLGRMITATFGLIEEGKTALIEMADTSGLKLLKQGELNPLKASSYGTGEMIKHALDAGVRHIIIGMGGSATVDGGTGILQALGVRFLNEATEELLNLPEELTQLKSINLSGLDKRLLDCKLTVMCDVDNRLLGEMGSAAVFGPQKGADAEAVAKLEAALSSLQKNVLQATQKDMATVAYGGTAGGAAAGLYALLNAELVNGAAYFLQLTGFDESLQNATIVITGEGSIDEQTLQGKGPFAVALKAKKNNLPVIGLAGKIPLQKNEVLSKYFDALLAINNGPSDVTMAMKNTANDLTRVACEIGNLLAINTHLFKA